VAPLRRHAGASGSRRSGLGHRVLKIAHHLAAEVVQFTRTPDKAAEARALSADDVVLSTDQQQMTASPASRRPTSLSTR
jgi:alcohol dehydrogenase (NADP+)